MNRTQLLPGPRTTARTLSIATMILVSTGCAGPAAQVSQRPSISAAATASATPIASASPTPSPARTAASSPSAHAPSGLADIAEVVTTDLVMRSAPGTGANSEVYNARLSAPTLLYVVDGPVTADGYDWYLVAPFEEFYSDVVTDFGLGWVAGAGKDGEAWIVPWTGTCPAPAVDELMYRSYMVALACFGDAELTLEGTLGDCSDSEGTVSPSWLADGWCVLVPFDYEGELLAGFYFRQERPTPQVTPGQGVAVRVTGHFDDPAARDCVDHPPEGSEPSPPELTILGCRAQFVATAVTQPGD